MTQGKPSPPLFLLSGIMASGKSTVAQALAERFPRSVHLRGDIFRRMIVRGQAEMNSAVLAPEAAAQLELRYRMAAKAALEYQKAGFSVVYQDIIVGQPLPQVIASLTTSPLYVVVLCPGAEAVAERAAARQKGGYSAEFTPRAFDEAMRRETPRIGLWLDSSALGVEQTVDELLARLGEARVR